MFRPAVGLLGLVLALFPERSLRAYERVAIADPETTTRRAWVRPWVRVEGLVLAWCSLRGGTAFARVSRVVVLGGLAALLAPRHYLALGARLGYRGGVTWTGRFTRLVRLLGALDVLVAGRWLARHADRERVRTAR